MSWYVPNDEQNLSYRDIMFFVLKYYKPPLHQVNKHEVARRLVKEEMSIQSILDMKPLDWQDLGLSLDEGKNIQMYTQQFRKYRDNLIKHRNLKASQITRKIQNLHDSNIRKTFLPERAERLLSHPWRPDRKYTTLDVELAPKPRALSPTATPWAPPSFKNYGDTYFGKAQQIKILKQIARSRPVWTPRTVDKMYNYLYK